MGAPAYFAAALVGHSRILARAHWVEDVVGAGIIAIGMTFLIVKPYKKLKVQLLPTSDLQGIGLNANYSLS